MKARAASGTAPSDRVALCARGALSRPQRLYLLEVDRNSDHGGDRRRRQSGRRHPRRRCGGGFARVFARHRRLPDAGIRRNPDRDDAVRGRGPCRDLHNIGPAPGGTADAPGAEARWQQRKRAMSTVSAHEAWLLEARSLTRRFGGLLAVDGVDLSVGRGSVHGLIGPNGAGKTTLLNLVAGVYAVSSGTLHFGARDITRYSTAKRARAGIRRTFQNLKLFGEMTALENVALGLHADTRSGFFD